MIVDLMRNDLSAVCRPGTVAVTGLLEVAPHAGVWHLVSQVEGELPTGTTNARVLAATFPPGSVTGVPKVRALEVMAAAEGEARGVYTGAVGFASPVAGLELAVAIRTFEVAGGPGRWAARLGVGGGVTAGSTPVEEWAECLVKAAPLLTALGLPPGPAAVAGPGARPADLAGPGGWPADPAAGLFETVLVHDGRVLELADHAERLERSWWELNRVALPFDAGAELARAAGALPPDGTGCALTPARRAGRGRRPSRCPSRYHCAVAGASRCCSGRLPRPGRPGTSSPTGGSWSGSDARSGRSCRVGGRPRRPHGPRARGHPGQRHRPARRAGVGPAAGRADPARGDPAGGPRPGRRPRRAGVDSTPAGHGRRPGRRRPAHGVAARSQLGQRRVRPHLGGARRGRRGARRCPARPVGCGRGRPCDARRVRLSEFWTLVDEEFGATQGRTLVRDHVVGTLRHRTPAQALEDGEEPREVWLALCADLEVPEERWWGRETTRRRR